MTHSRWLLLLAVSPWFLAAGPASAAPAGSTPFSIHWTAPGDDSLAGRATAYEMRYSRAPITEANFSLATKLFGLPLPASAGVTESFVVTGLYDSLTYYFAIKTADESGNWSGLSNVVQRLPFTTGARVPVMLSFSPSFPNPARESVRWAYSLPQGAQVQVEIYDARGRHVHTVERGDRGAGAGELAWDLRDGRGHAVAPGLYFVKARLGSSEWTRRLVVVR